MLNEAKSLPSRQTGALGGKKIILVAGAIVLAISLSGCNFKSSTSGNTDNADSAIIESTQTTQNNVDIANPPTPPEPTR